jgi:hypothetical protein
MSLSITTLCHCAECRCAECQDLVIVMLNVIMLSVVMLNFIMLSVVMPNVVILKGVAPIIQSENKRHTHTILFTFRNLAFC